VTNPDYQLLKKYIPAYKKIPGFPYEDSVEQFLKHAEYYKNDQRYINFLNLLGGYRLLEDGNLYVFWLMSLYIPKWAYNNEFFKLKIEYNKEIAILKNYIAVVETEKNKKGLKSLDAAKLPLPLSISFKHFNKRQSITITSQQLLCDMLNYLQPWIEKRTEFENDIKNKKTYYKKYFSDSISLYNYLKDTHYRKNKHGVYKFIVSFLETAGIDWSQIISPEEYLKRLYKSIKSK